MTKEDIKLGIELNGLDETLDRLVNMLEDAHKDVELYLNMYTKELSDHICTKTELLVYQIKEKNYERK